jgi:PPIC-type PPIASE domain/SurA N-terminal domain
MLEFFRRHRGTFLICLTFVIIVSFSFWGSSWRSNGPQIASSADPAFSMYGKEYDVGEMRRLGSYGQVAAMLQMYDLYMGLMQVSGSGNDGRDQIYNLVVLKHEMKRLGIHISDAEAKAELEKTASLQDNGKFSPERAYQVEQNLAVYGMKGSDMLEVARLSLGLRKLQDLLGKNYTPSPIETEKTYASRHQTLKIQTLNFPLQDYKNTVQLKDEDIQKYYDENKANFKTPEKRAISYVLFPTATDLDKKPLEERQKAQRDQVAAVELFNNAVSTPGAKFDLVAASQKQKIETAPLFTRDNPPEALKAEAELIEAIFSQNPSLRPYSDPIRSSKGFYLFHITSVEEPKQQDLATSKDKIKETLTLQKAQDSMSKAVNEARTLLADGLKAGKKMEDLSKDKNLKWEPVKELTIAEPPAEMANAFEIAREAEKTPAGEVTKAITTASGASLIYVASKELRKQDNSAALKKTIQERAEQQERTRLFSSWFSSQRELAKLQVLVKTQEK